MCAGHNTDYLNLALRDGGVSLTMGLANGKQEMHIKPARVRFDDHQWHKVTVHRRIQEVRYTNARGNCAKHIIINIISFLPLDIIDYQFLSGKLINNPGI